jgi:hypothetical protein
MCPFHQLKGLGEISPHFEQRQTQVAQQPCRLIYAAKAITLETQHNTCKFYAFSRMALNIECSHSSKKGGNHCMYFLLLYTADDQVYEQHKTKATPNSFQSAKSHTLLTKQSRLG